MATAERELNKGRGVGYSQTARTMFELHKEYTVFVGGLKGEKILLANMDRGSGGVLEVHDTGKGKRVSNVS